MNVRVSGHIPWRDGRAASCLLHVAHIPHTYTPSVSRALFIAPFACLTPLLYCTTLRALNLP